MKFDKINSFAKINLSLKIIKKLPNKYHQIESLVSFIKFFDEIKIKEIKNKKHKIFFTGSFSKKLNNNNSISNLLTLLEKEKLLKNINIKNTYKKKFFMLKYKFFVDNLYFLQPVLPFASIFSFELEPNITIIDQLILSFPPLYYIII